MSAKVASVTGSSSGMAAATANELGRRGWRAAVIYIDVDGGMHIASPR
jgi:NAD(P)-dependent dehydrogenase (short-subunit alcohol dehydrogenase family)